jgi:hypothetical protein
MDFIVACEHIFAVLYCMTLLGIAMWLSVRGKGGTCSTTILSREEWFCVR